jgi:predicted DNA-binding transcriptional regulator AlpA
MTTATLDKPDTAKPKTARPPVERFALRIDEVAASMGVSRRAIERERAKGNFPKQDLVIGKMPLWRPETIRAWLDQQPRRGLNG